MGLQVYQERGLIPLSNFLFSGGEVSVKLGMLTGGMVVIKAILTNSDDVMKLLMLTDAIRRASPNKNPEIHLSLPYVPYARQDRVMVPGESLSIKVFCDLINSQNYDKVIIWDPHSDVTPALLNNCKVISQAEVLKNQLPFGPKDMTSIGKLAIEFEKMGEFIQNTVLVSPDAGANKKIGESAKLIGFKTVVRADKVRDPATGKITGTVVYSEHIGDRNFLIVDDICDGGRTFIELAKVLRPLTNGKIILYVTHGIFSQNLGVFKGFIDEIYCANSFEKYPDHANLAGTLPDNGHFAKV